MRHPAPSPATSQADVVGLASHELASVSTRHLRPLDAPAEGVIDHQRLAEPVIELRTPYLRKSCYRHHGERVVQGQRMMQAASDIYLDWATGLGPDQRRHY